MKTSRPAALAAALFLVFVTATNPAQAARNGVPTFPAMPSGWLTAFPSVVQTGTKPTLTWAINYPSIVEDYVTITPPALITADDKIDCEIRILGAGVTVQQGSGFQFVPTETMMRRNNNSWERIFYGTNHNVNPSQVVRSLTLNKNDTLRFGGRYYWNNSWGPFYSSNNGTQNVRTLVNGSTPPDKVPDYNAPSLESFIRPYLTPDRKVKIGPMDVIVFMELTHTDSQMSHTGYDMQDMVLIVTFKSQVKTNNGHGNNIDGVDSSNPGNAPFINLDTDPNVDDEGGGGGAYPSQP